MNNQQVSVLGGGWLGLPLAETLVNANYTVKVSTTTVERLSDLEVTGAKPCLVNLADPRDSIDDFLVADVLIVNIPSKDIPGFKRLIEAIEKSLVSKVLFVSSTSVYLDANKTLLESDLEFLKPCPLLEIEKLFRSNKHFETTILRFSGLMGYSRHPGRFFKSGKPVSNALAPVNMIHRDDCIGIISAILQQRVWGDVFNACADTHPSRGAFYRHMAMMAGELEPEVIDTKDPAFKIISNKKIKERLGYQFQYPDLMATFY